MLQSASSNVLLLCGLLLLFALGLYLWVRQSRRLFDVPYGESYELELADGATVELRRLLGREVRVELPPVLLVHGLAANHRNLDLDAEHSLARYLSNAGRDVWLVTLRHAVAQNRPELVRLAAMRHLDLPTLARKVCELTQAPMLDAVGFSLGGWLLAFAIAEEVPRALPVRRFVCIAAPVKAEANRFYRVQALVAGLPFKVLPLDRLALFGAPWAGWLPTPFERSVYIRGRMRTDTLRRALINVVRSVPTHLSHELRVALAAPAAALMLAQLARVEVPALFIAGMQDEIAGPSHARAWFGAWGAESGAEKRLLLVEAGHADLVLGETSEREVFTPVAEFLSA